MTKKKRESVAFLCIILRRSHKQTRLTASKDLKRTFGWASKKAVIILHLISDVFFSLLHSV